MNDCAKNLTKTGGYLIINDEEGWLDELKELAKKAPLSTHMKFTNERRSKMEISEAKEAVEYLQSVLLTLLQKFETETQLIVAGIDLLRTHEFGSSPHVAGVTIEVKLT